jgi:hypothetical protein
MPSRPLQKSQKLKRLNLNEIKWLGREDSNLRMAESKSAALPLGYAPTRHRIAARRTGGMRNITARARPINVRHA